MKESDFALEMRNSIVGAIPKSHYKKIPDQLFNPSAFHARFNPEKDYDAYLVYGGKFTALEYKLHKSSNAFPVDNVRPIQRAALMDAFEAGGNAYVVVGVRYDNVRESFFVPIMDFMQFIRDNTRKSIPLELLKKHKKSEWLGKGIWSMQKEWFE